MFLNFITNVAYFFAFVFLILLFRTFRKTPLSHLWQSAVNKVKSELRIKTEVQKAEENGEKPFYFQNGTIVIYAKTQAGALYKYKEMKNKARSEKKNKRKTA